MDDRARIEQLLGRAPRGEFEVVVRDADGDPVVVRNAPFLADGTPMPTRYYLVGADLVKQVSRVEAAGGVRAAEREIDGDTIAAIHERYAAERDAAIPRRSRRPASERRRRRHPDRRSSVCMPTSPTISPPATTTRSGRDAGTSRLPAGPSTRGRRERTGASGPDAADRA